VVESHPLRGLTVQQPWADSIIYLGKDIENRTRRTTYRGLLLIHAGLRMDQAALCKAPANLPGARGAVIGIARVTGCHTCDGSCTPSTG
jgi:hypothetical protein